MAILTCHSEGCGNQDEPIDYAQPVDEDGNLVNPWIIFCGVCGQQITDVK